MSEEGQDEIRKYKYIIAYSSSAIMIILWFNCIYGSRRLRWGIFKAIGNVLYAPFGYVYFRQYLMGEILTDCIIQLEDVGKVITYIILHNWDAVLVNEKQN